jgi:hypothetical protein
MIRKLKLNKGQAVVEYIGAIVIAVSLVVVSVFAANFSPLGPMFTTILDKSVEFITNNVPQ